MTFKNSNCDFYPKLKSNETQKLKLWLNSRTQILMKLKSSNYDETQEHELGWNSKTQIVKTQIVKTQ